MFRFSRILYNSNIHTLVCSPFSLFVASLKSIHPISSNSKINYKRLERRVESKSHLVGPKFNVHKCLITYYGILNQLDADTSKSHFSITYQDCVCGRVSAHAQRTLDIVSTYLETRVILHSR